MEDIYFGSDGSLWLSWLEGICPDGLMLKEKKRFAHKKKKKELQEPAKGKNRGYFWLREAVGFGKGKGYILLRAAAISVHLSFYLLPLKLGDFFFCDFFVWAECVVVRESMAQSNLVGRSVSGSKGEGQAARMKIKIPHFDNSALIAGYSKTVIGRCFNPRVQEMKSLLHMMPRIWGSEGSVLKNGTDCTMSGVKIDRSYLKVDWVI